MHKPNMTKMSLNILAVKTIPLQISLTVLNVTGLDSVLGIIKY